MRGLKGVTSRTWRVINSFLWSVFIVFIACNNNSPEHSGSISVQSSPSDCKFVTHAIGKTCVPINPQNIVVIGMLEEALALDVKPIGAALWTASGGANQFPYFLQGKTRGIINLGSEPQPNLERLLLLKPDLIVGFKWAVEPIYQRLSQIAPTVAFDMEYGAWKVRLRAVAELLGKPEKAEALIAQYNQRLQEFKQQMGDQLATIQVSIVRAFPDGFRIYLKESYSGGIVKDAGLSRPPLQNKKDRWEEISIEFIPRVDGDVIFLAHDNPNDSFLNTAENNPLWLQLKAVQQKTVYVIDHEYWIGGSSAIAANYILDDLFKYLVKD